MRTPSVSQKPAGTDRTKNVSVEPTATKALLRDSADSGAVKGYTPSRRNAKTATNGKLGDGTLAPAVDSEPETTLTAREVLALDVLPSRMLIDRLIPTPGAVLVVGSQKSGKTVVCVQMGITVASGGALFCDERFWALDSGGVLIVERDDPSGKASMREYFDAAPVETRDLPLFVDVAAGLEFGDEFLTWLRKKIGALHLKLVLLDSYTALRPSRKSGSDIVKIEHAELRELDELAKQTGCTILVIHHDSKGSYGMDWSDRTAGSYAMGAAVEGQVHVSRFPDLPITADERLMRCRGRHYQGFEAVIRFRKQTLDYELVIEGAASSLFADILALKNQFGMGSFSPKDMYTELGMSAATAHRLLSRLQLAGAVQKRGYGRYALTKDIRKRVWSNSAVLSAGASNGAETVETVEKLNE